MASPRIIEQMTALTLQAFARLVNLSCSEYWYLHIESPKVARSNTRQKRDGAADFALESPKTMGPLGERDGVETTRAMRRHKTATLLNEIAQSTKPKQQVNKVAH